MTSNCASEVWLRIYDLSDGKAAAVSPLFLKKPIRGIWHSSIQVYGWEYFYGGYIDRLLPEVVEAELKLQPDVIRLMGLTDVKKRTFERFLKDVDHDFTPWTYDLTEWNCNHFADVCSRFLLNGLGIPRALLRQPNEVCQSLVGKALLRLMELARTNPIGNDFGEDGPYAGGGGGGGGGSSGDRQVRSYRPEALQQKIAGKQRIRAPIRNLAGILVNFGFLKNRDPPNWGAMWPFNTCRADGSRD